MPSFVVTGASRGLGLEFIQQLSKDSNNVVVGLVRNKHETWQRLGDTAPKNLSILEADITDNPALKVAAEEVKKLTGGELDVLINNGALVSEVSAYRTLGDFDDNPDGLVQDLQNSFNTNVVGPIQTINAFIPLLRNGAKKKVITISTGVADPDLINRIELAVAAPYAISKAGVTLVVAKYNALYKSQGILFMAISPGLVDTGALNPTSKEDLKGYQDMVTKFGAYAPHLKGPMTTAESVNKLLGLIESASIDKGDGGSFVSHLGNKQWL